MKWKEIYEAWVKAYEDFEVDPLARLIDDRLILPFGVVTVIRKPVKKPRQKTVVLAVIHHCTTTVTIVAHRRPTRRADWIVWLRVS